MATVSGQISCLRVFAGRWDTAQFVVARKGIDVDQ